MNSRYSQGETDLEVLVREGVVDDSAELLLLSSSYAKGPDNGTPDDYTSPDFRYLSKIKHTKLQLSQKIIKICGGIWNAKCFLESKYDRNLKWARIKAAKRSGVVGNNSGFDISPRKRRRSISMSQATVLQLRLRAEAAKSMSRQNKWHRELRRQKDSTFRLIPSSFFDINESIGDDANLLEAFLMKCLRRENYLLPESLMQTSAEAIERNSMLLSSTLRHIVQETPNATLRLNSLTAFDIDFSELSAQAVGSSKRMGRASARLNFLLQRFTSLRSIASVVLAGRPIYADRAVGVLLNSIFSDQTESSSDAEVQDAVLSHILQIYLSEDTRIRAAAIRNIRMYPIDIVRQAQREMFNLRWLKMSPDGNGFEISTYFKYLVTRGAFCEALTDKDFDPSDHVSCCSSSDALGLATALARLSNMAVFLSIGDVDADLARGPYLVTPVGVSLSLSTLNESKPSRQIVIGACSTGLFARQVNRIVFNAIAPTEISDRRKSTTNSSSSSSSSSSISIPCPWVDSNGTLIEAIYRMVRNKVLSVLMQRPGSSFESIHAAMPFLTTRQVQHLLETLQDCNDIYEKKIARVGSFVLCDPFSVYQGPVLGDRDLNAESEYLQLYFVNVSSVGSFV
jgi:hypothetical protein